MTRSGPAQQAAVAAALAGYRSVREYLDHTAGPALGAADLDFAERLLISILIWARDTSDEPSVLRVFAGHDWMLAAPDGEIRTHACPICKLPALGGPRYPRAVCRSCQATTTDSQGRPIAGYNTSLLGGFVARFRTAGDTEGEVCTEVTETGRCWIAGRPCTIGEARFGGVVVQA